MAYIGRDFVPDAALFAWICPINLACTADPTVMVVPASNNQHLSIGIKSPSVDPGLVSLIPMSASYMCAEVVETELARVHCITSGSFGNVAFDRSGGDRCWLIDSHISTHSPEDDTESGA